MCRCGVDGQKFGEIEHPLVRNRDPFLKVGMIQSSNVTKGGGGGGMQHLRDEVFLSSFIYSIVNSITI